MTHPMITPHGTQIQKALFWEKISKAHEIPLGKKVLENIKKPLDIHLDILPRGAFSSRDTKTGKVTVNMHICETEMLIVILNGMVVMQNAHQETPAPKP